MLAVATFVLAGVTFLLVGVTVYIHQSDVKARALATRQQQLDAWRGLFRGALIEQVDSCRHWVDGSKLDGRHHGEARVASEYLPFTNVITMMSQVPADELVIERLLWQIDAARTAQAECQKSIKEAESAPSWPRDAPWRIAWLLVLDRIQALALLIAAEATIQIGHSVWPGLEQSSWLEPHTFITTERVDREDNDRGRGAPPWPAGHVEYTACAPRARDEQALAIHDQRIIRRLKR